MRQIILIVFSLMSVFLGVLGLLRANQAITYFRNHASSPELLLLIGSLLGIIAGFGVFLRAKWSRYVFGILLILTMIRNIIMSYGSNIANNSTDALVFAFFLLSICLYGLPLYVLVWSPDEFSNIVKTKTRVLCLAVTVGLAVYCFNFLNTPSIDTVQKSVKENFAFINSSNKWKVTFFKVDGFQNNELVFRKLQRSISIDSNLENGYVVFKGLPAISPGVIKFELKSRSMLIDHSRFLGTYNHELKPPHVQTSLPGGFVFSKDLGPVAGEIFLSRIDESSFALSFWRFDLYGREFSLFMTFEQA